MSAPTPEDKAPSVASEEEQQSRSRRFRFKRRSDSARPQETISDKRHRTRHHHHHHHRSKRTKTSKPLDDPSAYDDSVSNLPSDAAFRESLFDALGDDEGAAFWQGVYGQPIHDFPNTHRNAETGELEQMNDEDYAQFVRRRMWEKSWEGIEAAREEKRRDREREKRRRQEEERSTRKPKPATDDEDFVFDIEFEKSLRRGERRRDNKRWKSLWSDYLGRWEELQVIQEARKKATTSPEHIFLRNKIAWPVESGKRKNVNEAEIERFVRKCVDSFLDLSLSATLKSERVKWHPDKIQQRYGFMEIDDSTMQAVTMVFQVFDRMWNELRSQQM